MSEVVYIALAGNIEPERHIEAALERLAAQVHLLALSNVYRTPAIDRPEQPPYLNGVAQARTDLSARALKFEVLRPLESMLGRVRTADKFAPRGIDLDILLFGNQTHDEPDLIVPDPDLARRPFLAAALLDCWPEAALPDGRVVRGLFPAEALAALERAQAFSAHLKQRFCP